MSDGNDDGWHGLNPFDGDRSLRDTLYPRLHRLRTADPVNETPVGLWRLTRYADVLRLLREVPAGVRTRDGAPYSPQLDDEGGRHGRGLFMLFQDPPVHTRLRKLVSRAFTPRAVARTEENVQAIVTEHLDRVADQGHMDVVSDFAYPLPSTVICQMLGVPVEDRPLFTEWTAHALHATSPDPFPDPAIIARANHAADNLADYVERLIETRRQNLGEDLMSGLIRVEEEGDRLSTLELVSQTIGLLIAGFETTIGLVANGIRALILHPEELGRLRADPSLLPGAIDECLRWDGPVPATLRVLHEDCRFGDKIIPADTPVLGLLAAANRDPEVFPDPDRFDITRSPNEHLAFGGGVHFCLGAHLARLEGKIAIGSLLERFTDLELESTERIWSESPFQVPGSLPIRFRAK